MISYVYIKDFLYIFLFDHFTGWGHVDFFYEKYFDEVKIWRSNLNFQIKAILKMFYFSNIV